MMSVPALALFYGGMVRSKNMLSMLMQVFVVFSLITVLWCIYGYSLGVHRGQRRSSAASSRLFLKGTFDAGKGEFATAATFSKGVVIPELVFVAFQATFAAITCCLILGAFAERVKFSAVLIFMRALVHLRLRADRAHGLVLDGPGCLHGSEGRRRDERQGRACIWQWGALDFAGGTVVHINAGVAGLVGAYRDRQAHRLRQGSHDAAQPAADDDRRRRCCGWAGSASTPARRSKPNDSRRARLHQHLPRHRLRGARRGRFGEWMFKGKPSMLACRVRRGCRAGGDHARGRERRDPCAFVIGIAAGLVCLWGVNGLSGSSVRMTRSTRSVCTPSAGSSGRLLTGVFSAAPSLGGPSSDRLGHGGDRLRWIGEQLWVQHKAVILTIIWTGVVAFIAYKIADMVVRLRLFRRGRARGYLDELPRRGCPTTHSRPPGAGRPPGVRPDSRGAKPRAIAEVPGRRPFLPVAAPTQTIQTPPSAVQQGADPAASAADQSRWHRPPRAVRARCRANARVARCSGSEPAQQRNST